MLLQVEAEPAARAFYEEAAAAAAALGICVDLYAASEEGVGLTFLEPLGSITGGATYLYPALDEATLPQVAMSAKHLWPALNIQSMPNMAHEQTAQEFTH